MQVTELIERFKFDKLLKSDPQTKLIVLLGTIDSQWAIVTIEKSHFIINDEVKVTDIIDQLKLIQNNDVYYWSSSCIHQSLPGNPGAKVNLIYPATETHIKKYSPQKFHMVLETPDMYHNYVIPYIETMKGDRIKWVYNILFEGKESETFVYHDKHLTNGFVLLPDMKWDGTSMDSLYLCCIVNRKDISTVRDLNRSHIDYLKSLKTTILDVSSNKYNIDKDELRLFVHYQPSYYHFHIHVVTVKHPGLGDGINAGKAILLDDIIENITLVSDYYQRKTIPYLLGENHGLWHIQEYKQAHLDSN